MELIIGIIKAISDILDDVEMFRMSFYDGYYMIDNLAAECAIRPFTVCRQNM